MRWFEDDRINKEKYRRALEQYRDETSGNEQSFKKSVEEYGQKYITYYEERWREVNER